MEIKPFEHFVGGYNVDISPQIAYERTLNMYVTNNPRTPEQLAFASLPGLSYISTVSLISTGRPLGLFSFRSTSGQDLYQVIGDRFFKNQAYVHDIFSLSSAIWWSYTSTQVTFSDGNGLYVYDIISGVFTTVSAAFIASPGPITSINGRVIVPLLGTNTFFASAENDATLYDANRYAIFQLIPDVLMGSTTVNSRLLLIGQIHTESWFPVATVGIPLNRDNNVTINYGTWASSSILSATEESGPTAAFWLARDKDGGAFFVMSEGTSSEKISTTQIDILLQTFQRTSIITDCYGWSIRINGHLLIYWNFPSANYTLVYDANVKIWTEAQMLNGNYFMINAHAFANGIHYGGSRIDGALYSITHDSFVYYTESNTAENIHRSRIGPRIRAPGFVKFEMPYLEIKFDSGNVDQNFNNVENNPVCYLQTSRDYDAFNNALAMPIGKIGQYFTKVYWRGLGTQYDMLVKIDCYEPMELYILGAAYSLAEGMA